MKGINNDQLPEYANLMAELVEYLHTPQYINFFKNYDKKLTKNMVKRCVVEPFCDKFLKAKMGEEPEIARWKEGVAIEQVGKLLIEVNQYDMLTENLREVLKEGLDSFMDLINKDAVIKAKFTEADIKALQDLQAKCRLADTDVVLEQNTKVALLQRFSNKKVNHMPKYVKELLHLDN